MRAPIFTSSILEAIVIVLSTNPGLYTVWWTQWYYTWSARLRIFIQLMHRQTRFDFSPVFYLAQEGTFYAVIIQNHLKWDTCKCSDFCLKVYIYIGTQHVYWIYACMLIYMCMFISRLHIQPPPPLSLSDLWISR